LYNEHLKVARGLKKVLFDLDGRADAGIKAESLGKNGLGLKKAHSSTPRFVPRTSPHDRRRNDSSELNRKSVYGKRT